jgi:hypothetical protein
MFSACVCIACAHSLLAQSCSWWSHLHCHPAVVARHFVAQLLEFIHCGWAQNVRPDGQSLAQLLMQHTADMKRVGAAASALICYVSTTTAVQQQQGIEAPARDDTHARMEGGVCRGMMNTLSIIYRDGVGIVCLYASRHVHAWTHTHTTCCPCTASVMHTLMYAGPRLVTISRSWIARFTSRSLRRPEEWQWGAVVVEGTVRGPGCLGCGSSGWLRDRKGKGGRKGDREAVLQRCDAPVMRSVSRPLIKLPAIVMS